MKSPRTIRTLAVIATTGLLVGAFAAAPAEAKKKKKKKKPPVCSTFVPGEAGQDKPMVVLTDAATEAAPVEQAITLGPEFSEGLVEAAGGPAHPSDLFNVQVDSAVAEAGLYVLFEFPERRDYDLNLFHTDGSYAARAHGFNPVLGIDGAIDEEAGNLTGHGGESTPASEKLVGIRTSDCGGWTVSGDNYLGEGGDFTMKLWLGEITNDPQAPGTETP